MHKNFPQQNRAVLTTQIFHKTPFPVEIYVNLFTFEPFPISKGTIFNNNEGKNCSEKNRSDTF